MYIYCTTNLAYLPEGGLDIVASAERITGATDAFDDLAEFAQLGPCRHTEHPSMGHLGGNLL